MREIKFRAWDKLLKNMRPENNQDLFTIRCDGMISGSSTELVLMQYTGLKDKNGKEIYEGDIMLKSGCSIYPPDKHQKNTSSGLLTTVIYEEDGMGDGYDSVYMIGYNADYQNQEIVGNIHENPELLDG